MLAAAPPISPGQPGPMLTSGAGYCPQGLGWQNSCTSLDIEFKLDPSLHEFCLQVIMGGGEGVDTNTWMGFPFTLFSGIRKYF